MKKTVLITGASTGFGKLAAKKFQQEDWNVIATMRSPQKETELNQLNNVLVTRLDVTDKDSIQQSIQEGIEKFGGIDVDRSDTNDPSSDPEVLTAFRDAHTTLNFWYNQPDIFPYDLDDMMDNSGQDVHLVVDAVMLNSTGDSICPNIAFHSSNPDIWGHPDFMVYCNGMAVTDVIAHERCGPCDQNH